MDGAGGEAAARPVALHPYAIPTHTTPTTQLVHPMTLTPSLISDISWCQIPTYPVETPIYDGELSINYSDLANHHKYEAVKYDYGDLRKPFEEQRLYHKTEPIKEEEKDDPKEDTTPVKRGRPTENPCWNYFVRLDDQNVRCRLCSKVVKSACATNMTKHLERHHQQDYQHLIVQIKQYRSQKGPPMPTAEQQLCLPEHYIKTEAYDTYTPQDPVSHPYVNYERPEAVWQRNQWNPSAWTVPIDPSTSNIDGRTGVITHGSMAVQSWNTSPGPSVMPEKPYIKRNRKTEHPVWEYFKRTDDGNAQCAICQGVVKSPCSSNFMRHLMRHHTSEYNNVYVKWVQKRGPHK